MKQELNTIRGGRPGFKDLLKQIAKKLKIGQDQEEWVRPRRVASNLRKAIKERKRAEMEAFNLREQEKGKKIC